MTTGSLRRLSRSAPYVLDRLDEAGPALNGHRALLVTGPLRADGVRQALGRLTDRHEILRTRLADESGRLVQVVADGTEPDLVFEDLSMADDPLDSARELAAALVARPFALGVAPLWRTLLVRLDADRHVLVLSMHAAIADAETLVLLLQEFLDLYASTGGEATTPRQYREHVARQRTMDAAFLARQQAYWRAALRDQPQPARLPTFGPRPATRTFRAARHRSLLPTALAAEAKRLAARAEVGLAPVLTTGFAALLYRYGARAEVTFGQVGSTRGEGETMLGPCGNPVALSVVMDTATTFESALRLTADRLMQAEANLDVPFQRVARTLTTLPFQLVFDVEPDLPLATDLARHEAVDIAGLQVTDFDVHPASSTGTCTPRFVVAPTALPSTGSSTRRSSSLR
jgi:condensation domain-containing protein